MEYTCGNSVIKNLQSLTLPTSAASWPHSSPRDILVLWYFGSSGEPIQSSDHPRHVKSHDGVCDAAVRALSLRHGRHVKVVHTKETDIVEHYGEKVPKRTGREIEERGTKAVVSVTVESRHGYKMLEKEPNSIPLSLDSAQVAPHHKNRHRQPHFYDFHMCNFIKFSNLLIADSAKY